MTKHIHCYWRQQNLEEATAVSQRLVVDKTKYLGPDNFSTLNSVDALGVCYMHQREYELARKQYEIAFASRKKTVGPDHPDTLTAQCHIGEVLFAQGQFDQAEKLLQDALRHDVCRELFGEYRNFFETLAEIYESSERLSLAAPIRQSLRDYAEAQ